VTTTACKTSSGSSSFGRGADDDEEEKITDIDQGQRASISEDEEEEEEEGNPLPGTPQQPEQALDQENEAFQQLEQQQHDKEDEQPAEQEGEEAGVEDAEIMSKECDMTQRLQFWYRNSKDRMSIEWWCDAVDRIWDQKGWNNEQGKKSAASVAVDSLREEAALLMSIIAEGHQSAAVKDWSLMKPILIKRYSTIKTCTQRAKQFARLTQKSGEPVENF
jgi:FtsZ-interacting cell division protein ZipA